jgi:hypothetical protein
LLLSAIVISTPPNQTEIPTMTWTASGGAFLETNQTSVRWVAPSGGVYSVTARAVNSVSSASKTSDFFVGGGTELVHDQAVSIRLVSAPTDFYYLKTVNNIALGSEVSAPGACADRRGDLPAAVDGANGRYLTTRPT